MTKKKPPSTTASIATYLLFAILIILGGLLTGKLVASLDFSSLLEKNTPPLQKTTTRIPSIFTEAQKRELDAAREEMDKASKSVDYLVAIPHSGPLIETLDLDVEYHQQDQAHTTLSLDQASSVQIGQDVILYDQENYVLPLGAKVSSIEEEKVTIALPEGTNSELLNPTQSIIIKQTSLAKRLPLTALQEDEQGKTFIWRVDLQQEEPHSHPPKTSLKRFYIDASTLQKGDTYFAAPYEIDTYDLVILNPNAKLRSDKAYHVLEVDLDAPLHTPIKQAWYNYQEYLQELARKKHEQDLYDCQHGIRAPQPGDYTTLEGPKNDNPPLRGSCGGTLPFTDPVAIFKQLVTPPTNACGNTSCGP